MNSQRGATAQKGSNDHEQHGRNRYRRNFNLEEAADETRPRKKTATKKYREPRKGRERENSGPRRNERGTKKIATAAAESRKKSRSHEGRKAEGALKLRRRKDG